MNNESIYRAIAGCSIAGKMQTLTAALSLVPPLYIEGGKLKGALPDKRSA